MTFGGDECLYSHLGIWYIEVTVTLQLVIGVDGKFAVCTGCSIRFYISKKLMLMSRKSVIS